MVTHTQPKKGDTIGHWTVKAYVGSDKFNKARYECQCVCGKWKFVLASELANGKSKSCGCQRFAWRNK